MKIGVISSFAYIKNNNNYGALLQYYALQKYLKNLGHDSYWIRTIIARNSIFRLLRMLIKYRSFRLLSNWCVVHKGFQSFIKIYLSVSKEYFGFESIRNDPPEAECYITGSDQVWGSSSLKENYLLFAPKGKKRISYAASFGKDSISVEMEHDIKPWLSSFSAISVRESSGVDICRRIGINAEHLLDPTLLISANEYPSAPNSRFKKPYIYCYFLNTKSHDDVFYNDIISFSQMKQLDLHVCAVQGSEIYFNDKYLVSPSPENWLTDYRHADFLFTNTFHGTVFAIIYHKPFVVILQKGASAKQNGRLLSLLRIFNLECQIWDGRNDIEIILQQNIDWTHIDKIKNDWINKTNLFFNSNLC